MKHTKRTLTLLLTAAMLSACLLSLAGCKSTTTDDPFDDVMPSQSDKEGSNDQTITDPNSGFDSNNPHGEKMLYGKDRVDRAILKTGDMFISRMEGDITYFTFDAPNDAKFLCFDPICQHDRFSGTCSAGVVIGMPDYQSEEDRMQDPYAGNYPYSFFLDYYDNVSSPVLYLSYLRSGEYKINEESGMMEMLYCIERFDIEEGKRYTILENYPYVIEQVCSYGDYLYFVQSEGGGVGRMICRIHKSGGQPERIDKAEYRNMLCIVDVVDEKLYYLLNERYLYRCNLDLTGSEKLLDFAELKGSNDTNAIVCGSYGGYLYYMSDVEEVHAKSFSDYKCNLYRIPMNDLSKSPERVVEGMLYSAQFYAFTEKTLFYQPCVYEYVGGGGMLEPINFSDGDMMALDLESGESKLIADDTGMIMNIKFAWNDMVVFSGFAYKQEGYINSGLTSPDSTGNYVVAYTSGEPYGIWCKKNELGRINSN